MSHSNLKRLRYEEEENDNVSMNSSMDNTANGDAKDAKMTALESKNALLELKNENLEGKLENQALKAKIRELMEENAALKQANGEQMTQVHNFEKMDAFMKQLQEEITEFKADAQKEIYSLAISLQESQQKAQLNINVMAALQQETDIAQIKAKNQENFESFEKKWQEENENAQRKMNEFMSKQQKEIAELKAEVEESTFSFAKRLKESQEEAQLNINVMAAQQQQKDIAQIKAKNQEDMKVFGDKLQKVEEKAQLQMKELMAQLLKKIAELRAKNDADMKVFGEKWQEANENAQRQMNELMVQQQKGMAEMKTELEEAIFAFAKRLKESQEEAQLNINAMVAKQQQTDIAQIKAKNDADMKAFGEKLQTVEEKAQRQINEVKQISMILADKPENLWNNLIKAKRFEKPSRENYWYGAESTATLSSNGLQVSANGQTWLNAVSKEGFGIVPGKNCRKDFFPGKIVYYYEMTQMAPPPSSFASYPVIDDRSYWIGLSHGSVSDDDYYFGKNANSYAVDNACNACTLSGKEYGLKRPEGIKLELKGEGDVIGCGLLLSPKGKLAIFFTANGILLDKQLPIYPSVDRLYPTVFLMNVSLEANFGDDQQAKPFKYDIDKCPGIVFE